jgi:hypothetical protein
MNVGILTDMPTQLMDRMTKGQSYLLVLHVEHSSLQLRQEFPSI